jgi:hypothetical protein
MGMDQHYADGRQAGDASTQREDVADSPAGILGGRPLGRSVGGHGQTTSQTQALNTIAVASQPTAGA